MPEIVPSQQFDSSRERAKAAFRELENAEDESEVLLDRNMRDVVYSISSAVEEHLVGKPPETVSIYIVKAMKLCFSELQRLGISLTPEQEEAIRGLWSDIESELLAENKKASVRDTEPSREGAFLTKLPHYSQEDIEKIIKSIPDEIVLRAPKTRDFNLVRPSAAANLTLQVGRHLFQSLSLNGSFSVANIQIWANKKLHSVDMGELFAGYTVHLSQDDKEQIVNGFLEENQE